MAARAGFGPLGDQWRSAGTLATTERLSALSRYWHSGGLTIATSTALTSINMVGADGIEPPTAGV
jgi:hypothetical protein